MAQLARGAGETLDRLLNDLRTALAYLNDGHEAVKRNPEYARDCIDSAIDTIREARDVIDTDLRDRLRRAESRTAERTVIDDLAERLARLENAE